jgi:phosphosulfolactate phosphohydrolase-like enzyme
MARWWRVLILAIRHSLTPPKKVAGKTVVLTTTNGTHALHLSRAAQADG